MAKKQALKKDGEPEVTLATKPLTTKTTFFGRNVSIDTIIPNAFLAEDEYKNFYIGAEKDAGLIVPPYNFKQLDHMAQESNALSPCIEAMVTNIDGTGFDFEKSAGPDERVKNYSAEQSSTKPVEGADLTTKPKDNTTPAKKPFAKEEDASLTEKDPQITALWNFFDAPWPGESFVTQRKTVRRDIERIGNGYMETLRNTAGDITFIRYADGKTIRLIKLDGGVEVEQTIVRGGVSKTVKVLMRYRRYAQMMSGTALVYFKEFGCPLDLDKTTGKFADKGIRLPANQRASELIHFTALPDSATPYGVPRWISQTPSVLGSRKAEEMNVSFFEAGGIPPVIFFLHGGSLTPESQVALKQILAGTPATKHKAAVMEVVPNSGKTDGPSNAKITVERFGSEKQNDSMFEKYDEKCEERIRRAFRLPPMFVGKTSDHNFATAYVSYTIAEAQVFKPERDEFDEIVSIKLLPAMGFEGYRMASKPIKLNDSQFKKDGLALAQSTGAVSAEEFLTIINKTYDLDIKIDPNYVPPSAMPTDPLTGKPVEAGSGSLHPKVALTQFGGGSDSSLSAPNDNLKPGKISQKKEDVIKTSDGIIALALDLSLALRKRDLGQIKKNVELVNGLSAKAQSEVRQALATFQFIDPSVDPAGQAELAGCTLAVMAMQMENHAGHNH